MAHYALLDENNIVVHVMVGKDENDFDPGINNWEYWYGNFHKLKCKRTSYNTRGGVYYDPETGEPSEDQSKAFRKNYAGIGYLYYEKLDAFIPPKPYPSWTLNKESCLWEAPIPVPDTNKMWDWNEQNQEWVEIIY